MPEGGNLLGALRYLKNNADWMGGLVGSGLIDSPASIYGLAQAAYTVPREGESFSQRAARHHDRFPLGKQTGALYSAAQDYASSRGASPLAQVGAEVGIPVPSAGKVAALGKAVPAIGKALGALNLAASPVAITRGRRIMEDSVEALQDVPDVPQSAVFTGWKRKPSPSYIEQREIADEVVRRPENVERSLDAIARHEAGGRAWYNTTPLKQFAAHVLEDDELAEAAVRGLIARMGPTSINTRMPKNVERALWATAGGQRGIPIGALDPSAPGNVFGKQGHPYYFSAMQPGLQRIEDAVGAGLDPIAHAFDPVNQQKTVRFSENLTGNYQNVPGDMWETRRHFGLSQGLDDFSKGSKYETTKRPSGGKGDSPSRAEHDAIEQLHREVLAPESGMEPAQSMAAEWMEMVAQSGGDERIFMQILNDQLAVLAKRQNKSPRKLLTQVIKGTIPKKSLGGLSGLALLYATSPDASERQ